MNQPDPNIFDNFAELKTNEERLEFIEGLREKGEYAAAIVLSEMMETMLEPENFFNEKYHNAQATEHLKDLEEAQTGNCRL